MNPIDYNAWVPPALSPIFSMVSFLQNVKKHIIYTFLNKGKKFFFNENQSLFLLLSLTLGTVFMLKNQLLL